MMFLHQVSEGTSLVFSNYHCSHQVQKLYGTGARKIISFFLLGNQAAPLLDARSVVVNWSEKARGFVESMLRDIEEMNPLAASGGNEWMVHLVQQYVVGDHEYVERAADLHRECRMAIAKEMQRHVLSAPPAPN